ncbi:serine protease inhibitor Kazal-type 6 [Pipistrellus kuhlii]|uniref:Serine peptidase inhibitor Kazal type 6 n=1 Tax=Pipistrellus kuhlii TaxID=59472 RepID=A0A7J7XCS1_PIPKU|nr:serine protease inhibitor Kazal-type 6 [Pipistrellus kuhlii]KAF6347465.1 serine peptidase inhibitor Kazal type 6 [Pipistrellus kuhlii]
MKISGVFLLLSLALFCFFSGVFSQGKKDRRAWITRSEGGIRWKDGLRRRLFKVDCAEFRDPKFYCTRESDPYCGSNGQTYGNKCAFCKAMAENGGKLKLKHVGAC